MKIIRNALVFAVIHASAILHASAESVHEAWVRSYNGPGNNDDRAVAVKFDTSGNVVVTGYSIGSSGNMDYYTAKYAATSGALLWEKRYSGSANGADQATALAIDTSDNVIITGSSYGGVTAGSDYYTAKYAAADGALLWEKRYNGPSNAGDSASAVAVDSNNDVIVTGSSRGVTLSSISSNDFYTAKYAAADGALIWEKRYNGPGNRQDLAYALAVDTGGNVVVTGLSTQSDGVNLDYYTAKYAAADGALLWEKRYSGPGDERAYAVAVDRNGNVIVTGSSYGGAAALSDYYTAKYAAADGALLWEKRYNGPSNGGDSASAVAVDSNGNVIVTGESIGSNNYADYYTAKYAAADGALLWEKRYNGTGGYSDIATAAIATAAGVDSSDNVIVTGSSYAASGADRSYTAKYAATDGTLLWEKLSNDGIDTAASALAVDGSNNVVITGRVQQSGVIFNYYTAKYTPDPPLLTAASAIGVTTSAATLNGSVNPNGSATDALFQWGLDTNYGNVTPTQAIGSGTASVAISASLMGLLPHTTYHFRATATNAGGTTNGGDATFTTANTMPVANGDTVELPMNHFNVKANDTDGDLDSLTVTTVGSAAHGTATLNSDNTVSYTPNGTFAGTDSFSYTISDGFGGMVIGTVTVQDTTTPVITVTPGSQTVNTGNSATAALPNVTTLVTATDNVGVVSKTQSPAAGTQEAPGTYDVVVTATDAAGLTAQTTVQVAVVDNAAPVVAAHANVIGEATSAGGATVSYAAGSAADNVGVTSLTYSQNSGTNFLIGITTVTITAKDAANNTGTGTFTVTVRDATAPAVAAHANVTTEATSAAGAVVNYPAASANDTVGVTSISYSQDSGTTFPLGTTTVAITAIDAANNRGTGTFTVTVQDTTAPMITSAPDVQTVSTSGAGTTAALPNVTALVAATDNVGVVSKTQSPVAGTLVAAGSYEIVVTVSDAAGHSAQSTVSVTVNDAVVFTTHPASTFVHEGGSVSFTVAITGTQPLIYQWEHDNQPIANETGTTLTISDAKAIDGGGYRCVVTNVAGSKTSDPATLEVRLRPRITVKPESQEVRPKASVTFRVVASGYAPMTYQWRKDGVDLPNKTAAELTLSNVTTAAVGRYTVVVTNEVASVESEQAELRLIEWSEVDGTYQGLLLHDNSASPAEPHYLGCLTVTLSKLGAMTGKLKYRGLTYSFSAKLTPELNNQRTILRKNQGPLNLSMHLDASAFTLNAQLSEFFQSGNILSDATMLLHGFSASKNPAPQAGRYTMRIKQGTTSTGGPDAPGYAIATISKSGVVKIIGKMSDGSALSCSALLNDDGSSAFYDPLYKAAYPYAGYLAGSITFDPAAGLQAVTGNLEWQKPAQTAGAFWPLGFRQTREVEGSRYIPPRRGQRVLSLPDLSGAMTFTASGPASFTNNFLFTTANRFLLLDFPNTRKLALKLIPATGLTTGSFYDSMLRKTRKLKGVVLQAQGEINGYFLGDTDAGEWILSPP